MSFVQSIFFLLCLFSVVVVFEWMIFRFIISIFFVQPLATDVIKGLIPTIPDVPGGKMLVAAFVGTTMASATFLSRPLFVKGKKGLNAPEKQ